MNYKIYEKSFLLLALSLLLFSALLQAQDKNDKLTVEEHIKAVLPDVSDKNLKAFAFSMSRNAPYVPGPDSKLE